MRTVRGWQTMLDAWGYTLLAVAVCLVWSDAFAAARVAAEGAIAAFALAVMVGLAGAVDLVVRGAVERRLRAASSAP